MQLVTMALLLAICTVPSSEELTKLSAIVQFSSVAAVPPRSIMGFQDVAAYWPRRLPVNSALRSVALPYIWMKLPSAVQP